MKDKILKTVYKTGGFSLASNLFTRRTLILTYHRFSRSADPLRVSRDEFERHLRYLKKHNTVLSLDEVIDASVNGHRMPKNPTVITIDDGYSDAYDIAFPLLKKHKLPATLYVITDFVDGKIWLWTDLMRYILNNTKKENLGVKFSNGKKLDVKLRDHSQRMRLADRVNGYLKKEPNEAKDAKISEIAKSMDVEVPKKPPSEFASVDWKQISKMDKSVLKIGSHTVTHPILPNVGTEQLETELTQAKTKLEKKLNRPVKHFCYPNGSLNRKVRSAVKNAGYKSATTTKYGLNNKQIDLFLLSRMDAPANIENFAQTVSGFEYLRKKIRL